MAEVCQNFSVLQSRKFLLPIKTAASDGSAVDQDNKRTMLSRLAKLCPSMDLILVQAKNNSSLVIYRSLSWQKVADIVLPESLGDSGEGAATNGDDSLLSYCWSPNGQCVAVARDSNIFLYGVESLVTTSGAPSSGSSNADWTIDVQGEPKQGKLPVDGETSDELTSNVLALHWVHVGKYHPTAALPSAAEEEREVSWR